MTFRHLALVVLLLLPLMAVGDGESGALSEAIDLIDANVLFLRHALAPGFAIRRNFTSMTAPPSAT